MWRIYQSFLLEHIEKFRQMLFVMGPRQVGKTTTTQTLAQDQLNFWYYNWDNISQREKILKGPDYIATEIGITTQLKEPPVVIFDEIHKYREWRDFLKGIYDTYPKQLHIIVTGSASLDTYSRGGDSLMGRYFPVRFHPLTVAECLQTKISKQEIKLPKEITEEDYAALWQFGGYPDPFIQRNREFYIRWKKNRLRQLFREDIHDLTRIQDIHRLELLAEVLKKQVGSLTSYQSLARSLRISDVTVRHWITVLQSLYYCFEIRPWWQNVNKSLLKEPKYYLWDWSLCDNNGAKMENFVASHLLKAVHFWTDMGLGEYGLYYLRDKQQREVDFLVTKNNKPFVMVEAKSSNNKELSPYLIYFKTSLNCPYAFQVVFDLPFINKDCFTATHALIVPAKTFLSQLV
jgi:predicted AAA+ superfamily ATPase